MKSLRLNVTTAAVCLLSLGQPLLLRTVTVSSAAILLSASKAQAKDASEIAGIAKAITVRIEGATQGSGVLIKKEGNIYTVLTSWHVIKDSRIGEEVGIITSDGKEHLWESESLQRLGKVDMAVITFTSKRNYQVAKIGDIKTISMGNQVFVAGFPLPSYAVPISFLRFLDGKVIANASVDIPDGYQLLYSNPTLKGMSGGCVLDEQGNLVGIHGREDGQISLSTGKIVASGHNMAVPITYYQQFVNGKKIVAATTKATAADDYLAKAKALLGEKGKENEVINLSNKALNFEEKANAYFYLAYAKHDLEDYKGSIEDYTKAIELDPEYANAYNNRGVSKENLEDYKGAIEDFTKAIKLDTKNAIAYNNRCWSKYKMKRYKSALTDCNKSLLINPKDGNTYDSRGDVNFALGDKKGACSDYKNAIANGDKTTEKYLASEEGAWCRNMPN